MNARRIALALALWALLPSGEGRAQSEDLLTPLTPEDAAEAPRKKAGKKAQRRKKPRPAGDDPLLVPLIELGALEVEVKGPPDRAVVLVDGREVKAGARVEVEAGERTLLVRRPGYSEVTRKVRVPAGGAVEVSVELKPVAGVLTVLADVPGSEVLLDGRPIGEAPVVDAAVSPGPHEVIVRREGFVDHVSRITVALGRDHTVSGHLRPAERGAAVAQRDRLAPEGAAEKPDPFAGAEDRVAPQPWYGRWYVWAGVGAVAAAAVTSAVVVSQNGRAPTPLRPEDVCGGACAGTINAPPGARF